MAIFERVDASPEWSQLCPEWRLDPNAPPPEKYWVFSAPKHEVPCGETVPVRAKFFCRDRIVTGTNALLEIVSDFHETKQTSIKLAEGGNVIPVTLDKPGFVRIRLAADGCDGFYGIGFSVRDIQPAPEVEGFDAYWQKQLHRLSEVPADVLECSPLSFPDHPGIESFRVRVRCVDGIPVSGILSLPEHADKKSLPAYLFVHGAGIRPPFPPLPWAGHGFIALNVSALGLRYGQGAAYEQEQKKQWNGYETFRSADPEKIPFNGIALRVVRALEYLKSRPEWDGKTLIVHGGSQGGWQSLVAAALDHDVTYAQIEAPANCNLLGALEGRTNAWPMTVRKEEGLSAENRAAAMFDGAAFARRAKAPATITVGYSDCAAVPSSVCSVYQVYGGPKNLWSFVDLGHEAAVFWSGEKAILEAAGLNPQ